MSLAELFYAKHPRRVGPARPRRHRAPHRRKILFEPLEPRILLSANLTIPTLSLVHDFTLVADLDGSDVVLNLLDTANPGDPAIASVNLSSAASADVDIKRGGSDTVSDVNGDTVQFDLDTFDLADLGTFVNANGGVLTLDFIGGRDISLLEGVIPGIGNDLVRLAGAGPTSIGFGLHVHSSSDIEIDAGTFTLTGSNDLTVESDSTITMSDTILTGDDLALRAGKELPDVVGDADSLDFLQLPSAEVSITDSTLDGHDVEISALSKQTVTITAAEKFDGALSFAELVVVSSAEVTLDNADVTASGTLDVSAESDITGTVVKKPDNATEDGDETTDAAVAVAVVHPDVTVSVLNGSTLTATGAATIAGTNTLHLTTTADGTLGDANSAGAVVAVSVVAGDTEVTVDGSTVDAASVGISATTDWTIDTLAKAAFKGAKEGSDNQESQERLDDPNDDNDETDQAATSEGSIEFAATVAVTIDTNHTWASVNDATLVSDGAIDVTASATHDVATTADGSTTGNSAPGVGVGVAVGVHVVEAKAWLAGTTSLEAPTGTTVHAVIPPSDFDVTAKSGASGGSSGLGFAGALAINVTVADAYALVDPSATLDLNGTDLTLLAESTTDATAKTEASVDDDDGDDDAGKSTGVGASISLVVLDNDTKATIGANATFTDADDVHLTATADHGVVTEAKGGAVGGTAVTPVVAVSVVTLDTATVIEGTALDPALVIGGELLADATSTSDVSTKAEGKAEGSSVAVGAAIAFTWAQDTVASETLRSLTTGGPTRFKAKGRAVSKSESKASAEGAEGDSSDSSGQDAQEKADSQRGFGNSQAGASGRGATDSGTENKTTAQDSNNDNVSVAAAISINIATATARAEIADGVTVDSDGFLTVQASENVDSTATADGTVNEAGTGIAAAVAINVALVTNEARIGDATITADGLAVKALMTDVGAESTDIHSSTAEASSGTGSSDVGVAGSVAINYADIDTTAVIETGADLTLADGTSDGNATVGPIQLVATAVTENTAKALPAEDSDGEGGSDSAGVGASFALNLVLVDTTAEIQDTVGVTGAAASLSAQATGDHTITTEAKNGAKGDTGVGVGVAVVVSESHTTARVGTGGTVSLGSGTSTISAHHTSTLDTDVASEAEGSDAAVGASVGVVIVSDSSTATLARTLDPTSGAVTIEATSDIASTLDVNASAGGSDDSDDDADTKSNNAANNNNVTGNAGSQSTPSANAETSKANSTASGEGAEGSSSSVGVAAAVAVSVITLDNIAQVTDGADILTTGAVEISAQAEVDGSAKALGLAVTLEDSNMIGAAVGVNVAVVNNKALVVGSSEIRGSGVTVEAVTTSSATNDFVVWGAAAGGGTGDVGVGGSVGVNVVTFTTEASVASTAHLLSTGDLDVTAENDMVLQTVAAGVGFSDGTSVGAAVAVTVVVSDTNAILAGDADAAGAMTISAETTIAPPVTLDIPDNDLIDDPSIAISSAALAGGGSTGGVGIAGAVAVTVYDLDTYAYIAGTADVNQDGSITPSGQSVTVQATSTTDMTNAAGALGISTSSVGVGAGVEVSVITKHTEAYIATGAVVGSAGAVDVDADSSEDIIAIAANAGIGDSAGIAGSATVQVITTTTRAYIGDATVDGGDVSLTADGTLDATMVAGSIGAGSSAGVGAAATVLVHTDTVEASIGSGATVTSDGSKGVSLAANSSEDLITIAAAGGAASTAGVAGSAAVNVLGETTTAYVGTSASVTANNGGDLSLHAQDDTDIISVAGNLAVGGTAGVGLGADVGVITKDTKAYIDSNVTADVDGDVTVDAVSSEDVTSVAAGISLSGTASVALDASVHVLDIETKAFIGDEDGIGSLGHGDVHAGGNVWIKADDTTEIDAIVGVLAVSGTAGVGAAGAVNVVDKTTAAFIGAGAWVTGDGNTSDITVRTGAFTPGVGGGSTFDPNNAGDQGIHADSVSSTPDSGAMKGQGEVNVPTLGDMDVNQGGGSEANDPALSGSRTLAVGTRGGFRGVAVTATNRDDIETFTISVAGGTAGVAVSAGVNVVSTDTSAYIADNAKVNDDQTSANAAQTVHVAAGNDFYHLAVAGSLGVGVVGVSPAVDVTVLSNTTTASIGAGATVEAKNDVIVEAHAREHLLQIGFGIGGGVVGIGGAVDVLVINNSTTATIGNGAHVAAGGDVLVLATDDTHLTMISGGIAGGFVGVGASVGVMIVNKDTQSFIGDGAVVDAKGAGTGFTGILNGGIAGDGDSFQTSTVHGVMVQAQSSEEVLHLVVAGGAGFVGVSGAVAVTLVDSDTNAFIGANALINQTGGNAGADGDQSVYVGASNEARLTTFVVGVAGGFVGVGGAVDVGSLKNDTTAEIRSGAHVDALEDVAVNAVGIHDVDGYTFSGAGGVVGLTAAVSVWSVGTPIERNYSDSEGNSADASEGENGAADSDAADQAETSSGEVSGLLSGFENDGGGNAKTSQNRVDSATESASSSLSGSAPTQASIEAAVDSGTPSTGTVAIIASGAVIDASDRIEVTANEDTEVDIVTGGIAAGLVGVGASVAVLNVGVNASATAGGTLEAGGQINVKATLDEDVNVTSLAGAAGFVGLGAAVVVIDDESTVSAGILNNADVVDATSVSVTATSNQFFHGLTGQVSAGAVGAGASFAKIAVDNDSATDTRAFIGSGVDIGQAAPTVDSVSVNASSTVTAHAETYAISAGIGAFSTNFAFADVTPEVEATIGPNANIKVTGAVSASATATPSAIAETFGVSAGGLAVGVSISEVEASPWVTAYVGGTIQAGSLSVSGKQLVPGGSYTAKAASTGSAGGLIGIDATVADATDNGHVTSYVANDSTLTIGGATTITATNNSKQLADSSSNTVGLVAAGVATAVASSDTVTDASLGSNVKLTGQNLTVTATGTDDNFADTVSGSIGFALSGSAAVADTNNTSTTSAKILGGNSASRKIDLSGSGGSGALLVKAEHTARFNTRLRTFSGGLLAGAGGSADNDHTSTVTAAVGASGIVVAKDIEIQAINHVDKPWLSGPNFDGVAGGFISGGGGDDDTTLNLTTLVDIGTNASLTLVGSVANPGDFILKAFNDISAHDKVVFGTGGAFSGLGAFSTIKTNTELSKVKIGAGASLSTIGAMDLFARSQGDIKTVVSAEAFGLGTYIAADARSQALPDNVIEVGANAFMHAKRDLSLYAGTDANFVRDSYVMDATTDTFAGSAIPIDDVDSHTLLITDNTITIAAGAHLETAGEARLHADRKGYGDLTGLARAVSWVSEVQDWLNGSAAAEMQEADINQEGHGTVQVDGIVETGIERNKELTLFGWSDATGQILGEGVGYTQEGDVTFTSGPEIVQSALLAELNAAQQQLNTYGDTNATLKDYYEGEIARIQGQLAAEGLYQFRVIEIAGHGFTNGQQVTYNTVGGGDAIGGLVNGGTYFVRTLSADKFGLQSPYTGNAANDIQFIPEASTAFDHTVGGKSFDLGDLKGTPTSQYAITVNLDPLTAEAGRIDVRTDQLQGSGQFIAPGDASIDVQNHTPAFIKINGMFIPEVNGGLFLNGNPKTTNQAILESNQASAAEDNSHTPDGGIGDTFIIAQTPGFTAIPDNAVTGDPFIIVDNDFVAGTVFHDGQTRIYPWPDIIVQGEIRNLAGDVTLTTLPAGQGNIIILASVLAKNLTVIAGGTLFVTDVTTFSIQGEAASIWGDITQGPVPGGDPNVKYPGLFSALESDAAGLAAATNPGDGNTSYTSPGGAGTQINDLLGEVDTTAMYAERIFIDAEYINLNGLLQSGKEDYHLVLDAAVAAEIGTLTPADGVIVNLESYTNKDFIVKFNTSTNQIILDEVRNRGGHIDLIGHVMNTGNGIIRVLGGYADFDIDNSTGYDLLINRIDDAQRGAGTLAITDKAKGGASNPTFTLYEVDENGVVTRTIDDGPGGNPTDVSTPGDTSTYSPEAGWRYGWQVGVRTRDYFYYHHDKSAWIGIDWLSVDPDSIAWDTHEPLGPPVILGDGPYYFKDVGLDGVKYTFQYQEIAETEKKVHIIDQSQDTTWYGETTYHNEVEAEQKNMHVFTHTIEADRPITVEFIGHDEGSIDVESNGSVVLAGSVLNPTGVTKIATTKAIVQTAADAAVTGRRVELFAGTGIGSAGAPVTTDIPETSSASLKATSTSGQVHVSERFGDLRVDEISSQHDANGSGGKVSVTSQGSILVASGYEGLVEGGALTLTAGLGIGTAPKPLILDAGVFTWDKVNITASDDVYVQEKSGDLAVESIVSAGDVHITVVSGGIVDANEAETRDERTYNELLNGVWHDLRLTASTGANDKIADAEDALAAIKEQEYQTYWRYRMTQPHAPLTVHEAGAALGGTVKYYVIVSGDTVRLAASAADAQNGIAIDLDASGASGTGHGLSIDGGTFFDAQSAVDGALETIALAAHGFSENDAVTYRTEGHGASIGLTEGVTYYVHVLDADTIQLKAHAADVTYVDLTPTVGPGNQALYGLRLFDSGADVDSGTDTIDLGPGHGLVTGDVVVYAVEQGDTALAAVETHPLEVGGTFYVIVIDADHVRLAATMGGPALDLDNAGVAGLQHRLDAGGVGTGLFDPLADVDSANDSITIAGHGFANDDAVVYRDLIHDPAFQVELTASEEDFYRTQLGYGDPEIAALEASRTAQYHTLHTQYGVPYGDGYDPNFTYTLTQAEIDTIAEGIHVYTEEELLFTVSVGLLKDIADTSPTIEEPNITAANLFLTTSAGVGAASGEVVIDVSGGVHNLTDDERVALAAAERVDVAYLGPAVFVASVDVNGLHTFHRSSGSWLADGFEEDMRIHVAGGVNATGTGEFYLVSAVTADDLTVTANLLDQDGVALTITPEVNDPTEPGVDIDTIVIDQREDVDVEIIGDIDVSAHASVYLGSEEHNLNLDLVQTDLNDDIRLKSGQAITNAGPLSTSTNVIGGDTILEAANGAIGTPSRPINTDLGASATITGRALTNIYIVEKNGNMNVEFMFAQTGTDGVELTTLNGSIVDALDTDFTKINANHVQLTASNGGIGEPGDYLDVDVNGAGTIVADADDDVYISETFGNMNVEHVQSNTGNVELNAFVASILDALNSPFPEIIGNDITLIALVGIGVSGNDVDIDSAHSGPGLLTSSSELANTYIIETDGSGATLDDLSINEVSTGLAYTAFITAPEGSILNGKQNDDPNVISGRTYLVARDDIGASDKPLRTEIGNIEGKSILGSTWIFNYGGLEEGGVIDTGEPGMVAGGDVTVTADSPIDVVENIVADNITLTAADDSADDHLVIHTGFRLETAVYDFATKTWVRSAGTITLNAGDSFLLQAGAQVLTLGEVLINGDFVTDEDGNLLPGNADPGLGATIVVNGTIDAAQITITGNDDADDVLIDVDYPTDALTGHVNVNGGDGHDLVTINELHTRASSVDVDGQGDTDDVIVNVRSGRTDYLVNVFDTGAPDDGADTLTINGTEELDAINPSGEDLFLLRRNFVAYLSPDTDQYDLHPEVERINYDENINGRLVVNGESGDDLFYSDDNSAITTLDGGPGSDYFQVGQVFGLPRVVPNVAAGDEIETVETTVGFLSRGISFPMVVFGGDGADKFSVYSNKALLKLFGEDGNDEFVVRAFVLASTGELAGDDTEVNGGGGDDLIQYNINAPVSIDGGAGADTVIILGTEIDDNFVITEDGVMGAGLNVSFVNVEKLEVDGLEGDDHFFVLSTSPDLVTTLIGGLGSDTIDVGGDVTEDIIALAVEGRTGFINHAVESADPAYNGIFAEGVQLHIGDEETGTVIVTPSGDMTVIEEDGDGILQPSEVDTYSLKLAVAAPVVSTVAYLTVSAAQSSYKDRHAGGKALQVSTDGVNFVDALVLTFDSTIAGDVDPSAWAKEHTIYVRGTFDTAEEGTRTVVISHSMRSENEDFNHLNIANVEVRLIDDDKAGVVVTETDIKTQVREGEPAGDNYYLSLTKAPDPGETVTVTLELDPVAAAQLSFSDPAATGRFNAGTLELTFDDSNWSTPFELKVNAIDDGLPENRLRGVIRHAVSSTGGQFDAVLEKEEVKVDIRDDDAAGIVVTETNGSTLVSETTPDYYDLVLTKAPIADVIVKILTDGQTVVSAAGGDPQAFGLVDGVPAVTFTAANWNVPFTVKVEVNPNAVPANPVVQTFPAQAHALTEIRGPLIVEGSVIPGRDRSLKAAVKLPTELDGPLPVLSIDVDESVQTDTLNVFDDGSVFNEVGTHGHPEEQSGLDAVYLDPANPGPVDLADFGNISGLSMGGDLTIDFGVPGAPDLRTFDGGVTYHGVEVVDVMLGQGNDTFTVDASLAGTITVVQGGGNSAIAPLLSTPYGDISGDYIVVNGGGGASAPLIVFGDTSQDGRFYDSTTQDLTGHARAFSDHGDDVIDAHTATAGLTIYGGRGDDRIYGSQAGDHIGGGTGDDTIFGEAGFDHIYGDSGFNVDLSTRISLAAADPDFDVLTVVTAPAGGDYADTHDGLVAGEDELHGGADDDLIFGDHGVIQQIAGTERLLTTGSVIALYTVEVANGADDLIFGDNGDGDDVIMGGAGSDEVHGGAGIDVIFGDHGNVSATSGNNHVVTRAPEAAPWFEGYFYTATETQNDPVGAGDLIYGDDGGDYILGEQGQDVVFGGAGDDDVYGGYNVAGGHDTGDIIDGGANNDVIAADNASIQRTGGVVDPRFRVLQGTTIYGEQPGNDALPLVTGASQANPDGVQVRTVVLFDHSDAPVAGTFGDDTVAGGADDDVVFGQLGNDTLHGDGRIADPGPYVLQTLTATIPGSDVGGDDYVEGNGGNDTIYGGLGQDDLVGGSSALFGLGASASLRPDGSDLIFGGNGDMIARNDLGDTSAPGHARDADTILGDNGNVFRLVGLNGGSGGPYLTFGYDNYNTLRIVPRTAQLLDYTPGGLDYLPTAGQAAADIGAADTVHGESGDDSVYGMKGDDVLFGEGQDDDLIGGYDNDWISGGTGDDGVLGDDGRIYTSRNGTAEPLYNIGSLAGQLDLLISTPGNIQQSTINVSGQLKKTPNLTPFKLGDPNLLDYATQDPLDADDIIYGGWGNDALHGGAGDDAISGAEALAMYYGAPGNPGDVLKYGVYRAGEFGAYNEYDPWSKVYWNPATGEFVTGGTIDFLLNFDQTEGPGVTDATYGTVHTDGNDVIFGDLGNDWLVGGTGRDHLYGGYGDDLLNADDDQTTNGGANNATDTHPSYEDIAYGGAGRDVLIANTGGDRLIDWVGEFNSYIVPFAPFGTATVSRTLMPQLQEYLYALSASDGADRTRAADTGADATRNGEPEGELGLVKQQDPDWHDQTGGPADPQAGNIPGGPRDVLRSASFNDGKTQGFFVDSGTFTVQNATLQVSAVSSSGDAVSVFHVDEALPVYYEITATVNATKPTGGWKSNAYVIFDYQSKTDFKFAGVDAFDNKLVMGHRDASGWHTDRQAAVTGSVKSDTNYSMLVAINGTNVTVSLAGKAYFSYTFAPRVVDGVTVNLNTGMVGVGSNQSKGTFDNVTVQVLPRQTTFNKTEDFSDTAADLTFGPTSGAWSAAGGVYTGTPAAGSTPAVSLVNLGLVEGLAVSSLLQVDATLSTQGVGGVIFDWYAADNFKFAAISVATQQVVIGHYTAKSGWVPDAAASVSVQAGTFYQLSIVLKGTTVSATVSQAGTPKGTVSRAYNAVVVDGQFGLLSRNASSAFDAVTVKTDDPALGTSAPAQYLMAASAPTAADGEGLLTREQLAAVVGAAISRLDTALSLDGPAVARLRDVDFQVVDLDGLALGVTTPGAVLIDADGAGHGWFVENTPSSGAATGGMDLLSVVMHELEHALGAHDTATDGDELMSGTLEAGARRAPEGDREAIVAGAADEPVARVVFEESIAERAGWQDALASSVGPNRWLVDFRLAGADEDRHDANADMVVMLPRRKGLGWVKDDPQAESLEETLLVSVGDPGTPQDGGERAY